MDVSTSPARRRSGLPPPPFGFGLKVFIFKNATDTQPKEVLLASILDDIRSGVYATQVNRLRSLRRANSEAYDRAKKKLPAVTLSGTCSDRKTPLVHSGLIQIDVDARQSVRSNNGGNSFWPCGR